jgi:hypothetical protein
LKQQQQQQAMAAINNASLQANAAVANAYAQNLVGQPLSVVGNGGASVVAPTTGVGSSHMNPNAQPFTPQSQNHSTITLPVQESPAMMSGKRVFLEKLFRYSNVWFAASRGSYNNRGGPNRSRMHHQQQQHMMYAGAHRQPVAFASPPNYSQFVPNYSAGVYNNAVRHFALASYLALT